MGLLSFFSRKGSAPSAAANAEPAEPVQEARTRARRRLVGAIVLVGIGIVGFPLVFETQPRPIPVDVRIEIPRKDGAAPLPMPPVARAPTPRPVTPAPREEIVTEDKGDAGREVPPPVASAPNAAPASAPAAAPKAAPKPAASAAPAAAKPSPAKDDAARAKALLEGQDKPAAKAEAAGRFVVQVGAFADAAAARDVRAKVEKAGLKTYTQVAETPQGKRIRVRVGPFASREEAEKAQAKASSAGLKAVVLTL